jgi:prepilin-type N-terminal cleavage/methylation domain-containing protein/prepilin-type processing-associated H-X9-DG protein
MKKKFTLIELLIVIAIIGILISILMPSLRNSHERARSAVCKSNLKQIDVGALFWSKQNDEWTVSRLWSHPGVSSSLTPYTGASRLQSQNNFSGLYQCPSLTRAMLAGTAQENYKHTSYAVNNKAADGPIHRIQDERNLRGGYKLSQVNNASRKVYFAESTKVEFFSNSFFDWFLEGPSRWHEPFIGVFGKSNLLYFDGHVSTEPGDFVSRIDWWDYYCDPLSD